MKNKTTLLNTALISGIFTLVVAIVMLFNYMQLSGSDPIESETLNALVQRLDQEPKNDQLRAEVRAFDLMARKAYFQSKWQIHTGAILLLLGAVVFIGSLRQYLKLTNKIEMPISNEVSDHMAKLISQKWLLGVGAVLVIGAITSSFLSADYLSTFDSVQLASEIEVSQDAAIEVVDLTAQNEKITENNEEKVSIQNAENIEEEKLETVDEKENPVVIKKVIEKVELTQSQSEPKSNAANNERKKNSASFRGYMGNGVSTAKNIPTSWDVAAGTNIVWKAEIPKHGFSSPVIWGDKLFVTGADNTERWVFCYNSASGELLWKQQANNIEGSPATAPKTTEDTGLAAPSVTTDGKTVVAIFGTGDIIAFDMNGKRMWARNLGVPGNHYGHSSSLLNWENKVFVQYDTNKSGRMLALNIETGETIWDISKKNKISWASPILIDVEGKMQIVTTADPRIAGYDIKTGEELWGVDALMGEVGPSPTYSNGLVIATNEYAVTVAINPKNGSIVWQDDEYLAEVASPVVADGILFMATSYGVLAGYDIHSGAMYWETEYNEGIYSSPVVANGKVFIIDMAGVVHIIEPDREYKEVANANMGEAIYTTPAFTDGHIYIRGTKNLYCIGQ